MKKKSNALHGIFFCKDADGCCKLITCGLSQIATNEYAFGQSRSGWGAELTISYCSEDEAKVRCYTQLLVQLAQYVNVRKTMFTKYGCINLSRIKRRESAELSGIKGIVFLRDTKLETINTLHGSVDFLQIIGVGTVDWEKIKKVPTLARQYAYEAKKCNPNCCFDQMREINVFN